MREIPSRKIRVCSRILVGMKHGRGDEVVDVANPRRWVFMSTEVTLEVKGRALMRFIYSMDGAQDCESIGKYTDSPLSIGSFPIVFFQPP